MLRTFDAVLHRIRYTPCKCFDNSTTERYFTCNPIVRVLIDAYYGSFPSRVPLTVIRVLNQQIVNMATLNLSNNGPSITKSYQSIVNAPAPTGSASKSPTYGQWAVYSVSAPLANAFQQNVGGKESVLKVQSTGGRYLIGEEWSL